MTEGTDAAAAGGPRFAFGRNWQRFLADVDEARIAAAQASLAAMLDVATLDGKRFLDVGCGSGLFSLAARRLGAHVHGFDVDPDSVVCARELKRRFAPDDAAWTIAEASALDRDYLASLGRFDVVYAWGVLHHTGDLWRALEYAAIPVAAGGTLFVAVYNDQGWISRYWAAVKRLYAARPPARPFVVAVHAPYLVGARMVVRALAGRVALARGMAYWRDMIDWLGGWPFEVARSDDVVDFYRERGFAPARVVTCGRRHGCNEFVLIRG